MTLPCSKYDSRFQGTPDHSKSAARYKKLISKVDFVFDSSRLGFLVELSLVAEVSVLLILSVSDVFRRHSIRTDPTICTETAIDPCN